MKKLGLILLLTLTSMMAHAGSQSDVTVESILLERINKTNDHIYTLCSDFSSRDEARIACQAQITVLLDQLRLSYIVEYVSDYNNETLNKQTLADLVSKVQSYYPKIMTRSVAAKINSVKDLNEFKTLMFDQLDAAILPMYNSTPLFRFTK